MAVNEVQDLQADSAPMRLRDRIRVAERTSSGIASWQTGEDNKLRIWDNVREGWSPPLERNLVFEHYLRKVVFKCTGCLDTSVFEGGIQKHISAALQSAEDHEKASLKLHDDGSQTCSGCGVQFQARKQQGPKHLERMQGLWPHKNATEIIMKQFSLEPSVFVSEVKASGTEPEVNTVERRPRGRKRKRSRGRRR